MNKKRLEKAMKTIRDTCEQVYICDYCPFNDMCNSITHDLFIPSRTMDNEYIERVVNKCLKENRNE